MVRKPPARWRITEPLPQVQRCGILSTERGRGRGTTAVAVREGQEGAAWPLEGSRGACMFTLKCP